jgi:hypothetical protein
MYDDHEIEAAMCTAACGEVQIAYTLTILKNPGMGPEAWMDSMIAQGFTKHEVTEVIERDE